ncbi:MAG: DUF2723 domain-containing protein, partial [Thermoanaerobaculia bacterium]
MTLPRWLRAATASLVFAGALAIYLLTLAPTTAFVDSGFLTVAAWSLGNAHPPGFPLYLLVTHLFTILPVGTVALRANVASAVFAAGACAFVALAIGEALRSTVARVAPPVAGRKKGKAPSPVATGSPTAGLLPLVVAMLTGGLTLASSRTLWSWATIAEVYALNTFLIAILVWMSLVWRRTRDTRLLYAIAGLAGLALGVHHLTMAMALLGIVVLMAAAGGAAFLRSRPLVVSLVIFAVALVAIYAYLPLAASHDPPLNWGDPSSFSRIVDHVTAKQYRSYVSTSDQSSQADDIVRILGRDLNAYGLPLFLALAGLIVLVRRDRALFATLAVISLAACVWMLVYPIVNDEDAYLLPVFVCLAIAAGVGASSLTRWNAGFAIVLGLPLLAIGLQWEARDRSGFIAPRLYAENVLRGIEPDGLLITNDQDLYGALLYYQNAERMRPDVRVVHHALLTRSWYLSTLEGKHPELARRVVAELGAVRTPLALIEAGGPQGEDPAVRNDFYARLDELVLALIQT